ncbi:MAG: hypothetical protein RBS73_17715 [Prolixibacteraceae bacterium]|jgi:CheY-like chemotaxis protein|nr:hypothetical protein [Prolixibacteraceae bacterium]
MKFNNVIYEWDDKIILIVEDEPVCCMFFEYALRPTKATLLFAHNGAQAVAMITEHPGINLILSRPLKTGEHVDC